MVTFFYVNVVTFSILKLSLNPKLDFLNFDSRLLRLSAPLIAPLLSHIFNLSLCIGNIPQDLKLARIRTHFVPYLYK